MRALWGIAFALAAALAPVAASAAGDPVKPLFANHEVVQITLKGPISHLISNRSASSTAVDATLSVAGEPEPLPVKLSLRGVTRRKSDTCQFPPIRVEFPQKPGEASLFYGQKKLKLTTHCNNAASAQQYVLLEYTAYRLYNLLTPTGFNARLAMVDYVDPDGRVVASRIGFFLENDKDVARRNGLSLASAGDAISVAQLDAHDAARQALFEYMIGNLDWSMLAGPRGAGCCHNTKLLGEKGAKTGLIPIPHDFDFAGLVDAPYATPPEGFDLPDVRTRQYRGHCPYNAQAQAVAGEFRDHRAELLAVLDTTPLLDDGRRRKAAAYLDGFFRDIATERDVDEKLLKTCVRSR